MVMMAMVHAVVCRTVTVGPDAGHVMVMSDLSGTAVMFISCICICFPWHRPGFPGNTPPSSIPGRARVCKTIP